jgi:hypothetical protein
MIDINRHRFLLVQILKDIYADIELSSWLGFKGDTALLLFYDLPRMSVDLDFNLINPEMEDQVYLKVRNILLRYGKIADEAKKFFGPVLVLDYGFGGRKLKVEISNRIFENRYEIKNLLGITMKVMVLPDMFAHKLCALMDRNAITNRDIFDCWFFMHKQTPINKRLVEMRMGMSFPDYLHKCIEMLESISDKGLLHGMGELMDQEMKNFVKTKLRSETIIFMKYYRDFPF